MKTYYPGPINHFDSLAIANPKEESQPDNPPFLYNCHGRSGGLALFGHTRGRGPCSRRGPLPRGRNLWCVEYSVTLGPDKYTNQVAESFSELACLRMQDSGINFPIKLGVRILRVIIPRRRC